MAIEIQYSQDLQNQNTNRSAGGRNPISRGDHRGRVRASSAFARIDNLVDMSDNDIVGFFEFEPDIRLLDARVRMDPLPAEDADFSLVAYDPLNPTVANKVVTLVPRIHVNRTQIEGSVPPTIAEIADSLALQFPLAAGRDIDGDGIFWNNKLVQTDRPAKPWEAPTAWGTGETMVIGDVRSSGGNYYYCVVDHTSAAAIQTDIDAGYWVNQGSQYSYRVGDYVTDGDETYKVITDHLAVTSFATGYAAGYFEQQFGIISINDAQPVADGVAGIHRGSFGIGLQGLAGTDIPADTTIQLLLIYSFE